MADIVAAVTFFGDERAKRATRRPRFRNGVLARRSFRNPLANVSSAIDLKGASYRLVLLPSAHNRHDKNAQDLAHPIAPTPIYYGLNRSVSSSTAKRDGQAPDWIIRGPVR